MLPLCSVSPGRSAAAKLRCCFAVVIVMLFLLLPDLSSGVAAKAPPFATAVLDAPVYDTPDLNGTSLGTVAIGSQVELTGDAAPGFIAVFLGDTIGWIPAQYLEIGFRPGIDTAVALQDTPLLDAPMRDAGVISTVPEGDAVILTGATVDGYDAASHEGAGGWINGRDLAR